jgi:hypothetical protein
MFVTVHSGAETIPDLLGVLAVPRISHYRISRVDALSCAGTCSGGNRNYADVPAESFTVQVVLSHTTDDGCTDDWLTQTGYRSLEAMPLRQIQRYSWRWAEFLGRLGATGQFSVVVLLVADANASPRKIIPQVDRLTLIAMPHRAS